MKLTIPAKISMDLFILESPLSVIFADILPDITHHLASSPTSERYPTFYYNFINFHSEKKNYL